MRQRTVECLLRDIEFAHQQNLGPTDLVPMLEQLIVVAPPGSEARRFGYVRLAELVLHSQPFRSASYARVVALEAASDRAWGIVGLGLTLLGHYHAAVKSYRRALRLAPNHVGHLHNLGHVLDVGLDRYHEAIPYLQLAHRREPDVGEIASSLAHAEARRGHINRAIDLLCKCVGMTNSSASATIEMWLARKSDSREGQIP